MNNENIVQKFKKLIELMKIENNLLYNANDRTVNSYRIGALEKNMVIMAKLNKKIKSVEDVKGIKGFGKGTIDRVTEILLTSDLLEIKRIKSKLKRLVKYNKLIEELSTVIGIGSITAIDLISKFNITSLDDLKIRVQCKAIKVNDKIRLGLEYEGQFEKVIKRKYISKIYEKIQNLLSVKSIVCGSYRRENETSHDIDLLLCDPMLETMLDVKQSNRLCKIIRKLKKHNIITNDITSENVATKYMGFTTYRNKMYRIDVRLVSVEAFYTALVYFTGSYQLNIRMRNKAKKLAYKLNEYGIYNVMGQRIEIDSEEKLFKVLQMPFIEPKDR